MYMTMDEVLEKMQDRTAMRHQYNEKGMSPEVKAFKAHQEQLEKNLKERLTNSDEMQASFNKGISKVIPEGKISNWIASLATDAVDTLKEMKEEITGQDTTYELTNKINQYKKESNHFSKGREYSNDVINSDTFLEWKKDNDQQFQDFKDNQEGKFKKLIGIGIGVLGAGMLLPATPIATAAILGSAAITMLHMVRNSKENDAMELETEKRLAIDIEENHRKGFEEIFEKTQDNITGPNADEYIKKLDKKLSQEYPDSYIPMGEEERYTHKEFQPENSFNSISIKDNELSDLKNEVNNGIKETPKDNINKNQSSIKKGFKSP